MSSALSAAAQSSVKLTRSQKRKIKAARQRQRDYQAARAPSTGSRRESLSGPSDAHTTLLHAVPFPCHESVLTRSTAEFLTICSREQRDTDSDEQEHEALLEEAGWEVLGHTFPASDEGSTDEVPQATFEAAADDWELV